MAKLESAFQSHLIKELKRIFPGCMVIKGNSAYRQGIPDLLVLFNDRWAALEVKRSMDEPYQPNQEHYIAQMNAMSFSRMICPENDEEVLNDLQQAFGA